MGRPFSSRVHLSRRIETRTDPIVVRGRRTIVRAHNGLGIEGGQVDGSVPKIDLGVSALNGKGAIADFALMT